MLNEPRLYSCVVVDPDIQNTMEATENTGIKLANQMLEAGAAEILKEAKQQTAVAVLEEKQRKDAERERSQQEQNGVESGT